MANSLTITKQGRRHYISGNTYPIKDALRDSGCHWDGTAKAWWTAKADIAARIVAKYNTDVPTSEPSTETMVAITGNTYPVREQLAAMGGRWNAQRKAWMVPESRATDARGVVAGAPSRPRNNQYGKRGRCDECGTYSGTLIACADSSGCMGDCCPRCARMSRYERSYG